MRFAAIILIFGVLTTPATATRIAKAQQIGGTVSNRDYPATAKRAGVEGDVLVGFTIGTDGRVSGCVEKGSNGNAELLSASCKVVRTFRFRPAVTAAGEKVSEERTQAFAWRLGSACPVTADSSLICIRLGAKR